jgi:signal transduction histidine kinase
VVGTHIAVMSVRLNQLAAEPTRVARQAIARRAVVESAALAALAVAALAAVGWAGRRRSRRHAVRESDLRSELEAARDACAVARHGERRARDEAVAAARFRDDMLANVSHELRTPLNAIVGWASVLKRGPLKGHDRDRAIDAVERNAAALTRIVNELLDVSQLMQGRLKLSVGPLDLRDVVRAAADTLRQACLAKDLTVGLRFDGAEVTVSGDEARLGEAAWHLLSNAVKHTPAGGSIAVEVSRIGSRARFRVIDSGRGIEAARLPHLFEPFRHRDQLSGHGLGVGLAIVRHVVELHGGTVGVESLAPGHGAVFTVTLPLSRGSPRKQPVHPVGRRVPAADRVS